MKTLVGIIKLFYFIENTHRHNNVYQRRHVNPCRSSPSDNFTEEEKHRDGNVWSLR